MGSALTRLTGRLSAAAVAVLLYTGPAAGAVGASGEDGASAQARRMLRERGVPEAGLQLVSREPATWSDSSLGCPMPGAQYTQALVNGESLRFANAFHRYEVHVAGQRAVLCPSIAQYPKRSSRFPVPVRTLDAMRESARTDLAARLGLTAAEVTVRDMAPATWANADLGCRDGTTLAAGPIQGYRIVLGAHEREYVYHTDFRRVMACPPIEAQ
jgi:hypothetical protein